MKKTLLFLTLVSFAYTAKAQTVAVSATRMNVIYAGIDNPIKVVVENMDCASFFISTNNGTLKGDSCNYIIQPEKPGRADIFINKIVSEDTIIIGEQVFRVKRVPKPTAKIGYKSSGTASINWFRVQSGIMAKLENFYFNVRFDVSNYTIMIIRDKDIVFEEKVKGPRFTKEFKLALKNSRSGDIVLLEKVYATWPDGKKDEIIVKGKFKIY